MADNVLIATANDANGAHQKVVNEYLDANGLPVSVSATNPLPVLASVSTAGLATSVGQTAGNISLSSINGKLPTGLTVTANRLQVELPLGGTGLTNTELRATPLPVSIIGGGDATSANQTTEIAKLTSIDGKIPALGQALATASTPVVLTAVQLSTLTPTPAISGFATSAKQDLLLTELQLKAGLTETQPVSVTALPLPIGAAIAANQQTNAITNAEIRATALPVSLTSTTITGSVAVTGGLTDAQIRATALPISGSVSISNLNPATETGLAKDATLTGGTAKSILRSGVKGTAVASDVTSTNIDVNTQALDVNVKGSVNVSNFPATQPISGTVTANTGLAQPLTNTEIRLTPLPISGTVSTGGLTDTQIRATPLPIAGVVSANATLSAETTKVIGTVNIAGTVPISGSVTSNIGTTNGLALDSTLISGTQKSVVRGGSKGTTVAADITSTVVDVNTQALDVSVKNNVSVTGTFFQTTQPVSLTSTTVTNTVAVSVTSLPLPTGAAIAANQQTNAITDLQIRATPLPISGTVSTGGLTNTEIRATPLPISGTVSTGLTQPLTDTQLRATVLPVSISNAKIPVEIAETQSDIHGQLIGVTRITQLTTKFFQQTPQNALNITVGGGGTATSGIGTAVFSTGTATTASVLGQTPATILYSAQYEAWAVLSGAFTAPTSASSFQRLGVLTAVDGFAFGYNGLTFGVLTRFNSVDTFIPQTSWNRDVLSGVATSTFRSNNTPVALAPTNMNMFRIRYGWYGGLTAYFEVYAPDGNWVLVHQVRTANSQIGVNITNPNLPMTVEVSKTASDATNLSITCGGWAAGITAPSTGTSMSGQQNIAALNANLVLPTTGLASLSFAIAGTWVGTLAFQQSLDGIIWFPLLIPDSTGTFVTQTTVNGNFIANVSTQRFNRVIATAWTSGTATLVYYGSSIDTVRPVLLDAAGRQIVDVFDKPARQLGVISAGANAIGNINELRAAPLAVTTTAAAGTAVTLTLPAVAGQFHYITSMDIVLYSSAARVGAAAPTVVTTTNLPGSIAFTFSTAGAIGTTDVQDLIRTTPLKSSAVGIATTVVCPIAAGGIWRITATYFTGA